MDGKVRHVPNSRAWEHIDVTFPDFANEPRNVRCGGDEVRHVPARVLSSVAIATGGTNVSRSTSNLASDAARVVVQHQEITKDGMARSGKMGGGGIAPNSIEKII
jgi:hypothetical protein